MNEKECLTCGSCPLGHEECVSGNGITEPPYLFLICCPYEQEYYKYPDDECTHEKEYEELFKW